jgi:hypothetical protein
MAKPCEHLLDVHNDPMPPGGCEDCLEIGGTWKHLRYCLECGRTCCCDDSPNRHARKHWETTGHAAMRSKEPGELWAWCYEHDLGITIRD